MIFEVHVGVAVVVKDFALGEVGWFVGAGFADLPLVEACKVQGDIVALGRESEAGLATGELGDVAVVDGESGQLGTVLLQSEKLSGDRRAGKPAGIVEGDAMPAVALVAGVRVAGFQAATRGACRSCNWDRLHRSANRNRCQCRRCNCNHPVPRRSPGVERRCTLRRFRRAGRRSHRFGGRHRVRERRVVPKTRRSPRRPGSRNRCPRRHISRLRGSPDPRRDRPLQCGSQLGRRSRCLVRHRT